MKKSLPLKLSVLFALMLFSCVLLFCFFGCGEREEQPTGTETETEQITENYAYNEDDLFIFGLAPVMKDQKWGYIDSECRIVIPFKYDTADSFDSMGMAKVSLAGKEFYINSKGEETDYTPEKKANNYTHAPEATIPNGLTVFSENGKEGLKDAEGNIILGADYDYISYERSGTHEYFIIAKDGIGIGFTDGSGSTMTAHIYERFSGFGENDLAIACLDGKWGFIDRTGKAVLDFIFEEAWYYKQGFSAVKLDGKWGFVDTEGKYLTEPAFTEVKEFTKNGIAAVKSEDKWGFINTSGEFIIEPRFDDADNFGHFDLAPACIDGKYGYINMSGEFVIEPQYVYAQPFNAYGYARVFDRVPLVGIGGSEGAIINKDGKVLCGYNYDLCQYFSDGYIICYRKSGFEFALITDDGEIISDHNDFDAIFEDLKYDF